MPSDSATVAEGTLRLTAIKSGNISRDYVETPRVETPRVVGLVFHRLELNFAEGVVVAHSGPAVAAGDAELGQYVQLSYPWAIMGAPRS